MERPSFELSGHKIVRLLADFSSQKFAEFSVSTQYLLEFYVFYAILDIT
jgi:hypothetical protein